LNLFFFAMQDTYLTLNKPAEGIYRDKGSRFLAFGYPVKNEAEIRDILTVVRKKYHDARHHCYAYRLGASGDVFRMNDDGEPSGTAGKPIYGQLLSIGITHVLVVVVRYFGGVLLGTGGLIQAYRSATADMLEHAEKVTRHVETRMRITFPYESMNAVMKVLKEESVVPEDPDYQSTCAMVISVRAGIAGRLSGRLTSIPGTATESLQTGD
jgi:uncharacterized YigZ family protein